MNFIKTIYDDTEQQILDYIEEIRDDLWLKVHKRIARDNCDELRKIFIDTDEKLQDLIKEYDGHTIVDLKECFQEMLVSSRVGGHRVEKMLAFGRIGDEINKALKSKVTAIIYDSEGKDEIAVLKDTPEEA